MYGRRHRGKSDAVPTFRLSAALTLAIACACLGARTTSTASAPRDERLLAFAAYWPRTLAQLNASVTPTVICGVTADGRSVRLTPPLSHTQQWQPAWSRDGLELAWVNGSALRDVVGRPLNATRSSLLAPRGEWPSWSPTADILSYQDPPDPEMNADDPAREWLTRADGSGARALTDGRGRAAWSPAGDRLALPGVGIRIVATSGVLTNTLLSGVAVSAVDWSPDGRWLAAAVNQGPIELVDVASGASARDLGPGSTPAWHPSGAMLAVQQDNRLISVSTDGSRRVLYTTVLLPNGGLDWQPIAHADEVSGLPPCSRAVGSSHRIAGSRFGDVIWGSYVSRLRGGDHIASGAGDDSIYAGPGPDVIASGAGDDFVVAGAGADRIDLGPGRDSVLAAAGNDVVTARDHARDVIDCGPGRDAVYADRIDVLRNCERVRR